MAADHQTVSLLSTNKTPSTEHIQSNQRKRLSTPPRLPLREGEDVIHNGFCSLRSWPGLPEAGTGDEGRETRDGGPIRSQKRGAVRPQVNIKQAGKKRATPTRLQSEREITLAGDVLLRANF